MRLKNRKKSAAAIKSMKVGTDELKDLIKGAVKEAMGEEDDTFLTELVRYHISGQLKVAPEHCSARVLDEMGKPHINVYEAFLRRFRYRTGWSQG